MSPETGGRGGKSSPPKEEVDGGALSNLKIIDNFRKKKFIIINGDLLINFNFKKFLTFHKKNKSQITLTCHPNDHPYDSDLLVSNKKNELVKILSKPHKKSLIFKNLASAGIFVINGQLIKSIPNKKQKSSLRPLIYTEKIMGR